MPEIDDGSEGPRLIGESGSWPVDGLNLIGRTDSDSGVFPQIDLTTSDPQRSVSRRHAEISTLAMEGVAIRDLGSANGTHVAGRRLTVGDWVPVAPGVEIRCGDIVLKLAAPGEPAAHGRDDSADMAEDTDDATDQAPEISSSLQGILAEAKVQQSATEME